MDQAELAKVIQQAARTGAKKLDLFGERITELPEQIGQLVNLKELDLSSNQLGTLPEQIGHLVNLERLNLRRNQLSTLPGQIGQLARLQELDLSVNKLGTLPEQIGQLVRLQELDLSVNKLSTLPEQIGQLAKLKKLRLSHNQLRALPGQIGQLLNVELLYVLSNRLKTLPERIGRLVNLRDLQFQHNEVKKLPEQIGQLSNLRILFCYGNRIERLPRSIAQLEKLETLGAGGAVEERTNPLAELPEEMRNLPQLKSLDVSNCPELKLPPEIVAKTDEPQEILDYYFRTRTKSARPLNEAKVLVVGEAEVGKTSLIKQLLQKGKFNPVEDQTHGIVTHPWDVPVRKTGKKKKRTVRLNVWDFGGQEIMHATHQFFLTKRSLYLLVLDSRQNERQSRIEYWLKLIHSFGGDSPVIVVCNKSDQQIMQLDWLGLQAKYPQIRRYVREVSCRKKTGIQEVSTAIIEEIARLEHVDTPFFETWFEVKQKLEDSTESCLPYADYIELCKKTGIAEEKEQRQLIAFLNDLGIVLHFHDHPILRDLNILNPLWVTTAVYRILTSKQLTEAHGVLTFSELGTLLEAVTEKGFEYPAERQMFVIEMMRRFELLFDFEGQVNKKFLLPGLLPLEQPADLDTDWEDALGFHYQYEVLPGSVISRFIVRMHQRVHDEFYWRKGVMLVSLDGDSQALVRADFEDERIDIRIRGEMSARRRFLQSIRDQFDAIHATIPKIGVEELVPLPGHPEVLVDYERLLLFEKNGKMVDYEKVGKELVEINVDQLLQGIRHPAGLDVFISYAHEDAEWRNRFDRMLTPLVRDGRITTWSDTEISASQNWQDEIDRALKMCRSGLLLVSPEFLASDFITEHELPYLLRAREDGKARMVVAVVSECFWDEPPLKGIQTAHDPAKPLDGLSDAECNTVIKSICRKLIDWNQA